MELFRNTETQEDIAFRDAIAKVIEDYFKEAQSGFFAKLKQQVADDLSPGALPDLTIEDQTCSQKPEPKPEPAPECTPPEPKPEPKPEPCPAPEAEPSEEPEKEQRKPYSATEAALLVLKENFDEIDQPKLLGKGNENAEGNDILDRKEVRRWYEENRDSLSKFEREGFRNLLNNWSKVAKQNNDQAGKETGATMNDINIFYDKKVQEGVLNGYDGGVA